MVSGIIGATLTDNFPEMGLAIMSTNTAISRRMLQYSRNTLGVREYNLMECADITQDELVGLYTMRSQIAWAKYKEKQDIVRNGGFHLHYIWESLYQIINPQGSLIGLIKYLYFYFYGLELLLIT